MEFLLFFILFFILFFCGAGMRALYDITFLKTPFDVQPDVFIFSSVIFHFHLLIENIHNLSINFINTQDILKE
ncbi:hypothetical protein MsAc7_02980 [Methanolapillus millepedarum]|uniref:Uncharacterized protein n=1 Tax=Methanolapillus millepedarum TaxID=3028296 RepID=A0AA97A382_9EURY|nr:hypothetical protein MsAc7_02980 [Methanosarcinaceae archaeon Ac7]